MAQVSWRADDTLVDRVRLAARRSDRSLNEFITVILAAATDPSTAGSEAASIRERLALAGLIDAPMSRHAAPQSSQTVVAAGRRAAGGTPLDELVSTGR